MSSGRYRSARSPGLARAQRVYAAHARAQETGIPVDEVLGEAAARERTRRELLIGAGGLAAGAALAGPASALARVSRRPGSPRIAIVGAGLAGLSCAHWLWTRHPGKRVRSTVYEAHAERAGGRCWTLRDFFSNGLITEHGGSFLNTDQHAVRNLASRLGLRQMEVNGGDLPHGHEVFLIDDRIYSYAEANADWHDFGYHAFRTAAKELNTDTGARRLDQMSVPEWLDSTAIGSSSRFGKLMMADTVTENGAILAINRPRI